MMKVKVMLCVAVLAAATFYYFDSVRTVPPKHLIAKGFKHSSEAPVWSWFLGGYQDEYANFLTKWREQPEITDLLKQSDQDLINLLYAGESGGRELVDSWAKNAKSKGFWRGADESFKDRYLGGDFLYVDESVSTPRDGGDPTSLHTGYAIPAIIKDAFRVFHEKRVSPACEVTWAFVYGFQPSLNTVKYWFHSRSFFKGEDYGRFSVVSLPLKPYSEEEYWDLRRIVYVIPLGDLMKRYARKKVTKRLKAIFVEMEYRRVGKEWVLYSIDAEGTPEDKYSRHSISCPTEEENKKYARSDAGAYGIHVDSLTAGSIKDDWGQDADMLKLFHRELLMGSLYDWWNDPNNEAKRSLTETVNNADWSAFDKEHMPVIRYESTRGNVGTVRPEYYRPAYESIGKFLETPFYAAKNQFYSGQVKAPKN
jgi:hypothetical protein